MAAAEEASASIEEPKKRKMSGKKLVLFILLPVLLLGGGGAAAYFLFLKKDPHAEEAAAAATEAKADEPGVYFEMPAIEANLLSTGKRSNFLKLTLWLETANEEEQKKLEGVMPRITNDFQTYLRSLRIDDLQGADGVQRMRDELLMRARAAAKPVEIKDVLIKAMLAQ